MKKETDMSNLNDVVGAPACGTTDPAPACGTKDSAPACGTACSSGPGACLRLCRPEGCTGLTARRPSNRLAATASRIAASVAEPARASARKASSRRATRSVSKPSTACTAAHAMKPAPSRPSNESANKVVCDWKNGFNQGKRRRSLHVQYLRNSGRERFRTG